MENTPAPCALQTNFTVPNFLSRVEDFNNTFGKENNYTPTVNTEKAQKFVYDTILEELEEYKEACEQGDIVAIGDALSDLLYFLGNAYHTHGLASLANEMFEEVHRSNMSKACTTEEQAKQTVAIRSQEEGTECAYTQVSPSKFVITRTSDGKVRKSIGYFPPDLNQFFAK